MLLFLLSYIFLRYFLIHVYCCSFQQPTIRLLTALENCEMQRVSSGVWRMLSSKRFEHESLSSPGAHWRTVKHRILSIYTKNAWDVFIHTSFPCAQLRYDKRLAFLLIHVTCVSFSPSGCTWDHVGIGDILLAVFCFPCYHWVQINVLLFYRTTCYSVGY